MSELTRLREAGSPAARALLAAGGEDAPNAAAQRALLAALGVAAPVVVAKAGWLHALKHSALLKVGVGIAVGAASMRAIEARRNASLTTAMPTQEVAVPTSATPMSFPMSTHPEPRAPLHPLVSHPLSAPTAPVAPHEKAPSLAAELQAISEVRAAIAANDGMSALLALDAYDTHCKTFAEESLALRVRALRMVGENASAANALAKLRAQYPESVHLGALAKP
jgi:hypothetical protein